MEKLISIIVPTYNMESYLHKCLSSIIVDDIVLLEQIEVLVVNDGSTDSSSIIAHSYEHNYPGIFKVIDKKNGNYGSCINAAIPIATGKYVKILDADDYYSTEQFSKYLTELNSVNADLVLNDMTVVGLDYMPTSSQKLHLAKGRTLSFEDVIADPDSAYMHRMAYRRTLLLETKYQQTEGISYTDNEWANIPLSFIKTAWYIEEDFYRYLVGRTGQTMDSKVQLQSLRSVHLLFISLGNHWKKMSEDNPRRSYYFSNFVNELLNYYRDYFFKGYYNESEMRSFDADMVSLFPEIIEYIDYHEWVSFIPHLTLVKDWRQKKLLKFYCEYFIIKLYGYVANYYNMVMSR